MFTIVQHPKAGGRVTIDGVDTFRIDDRTDRAGPGVRQREGVSVTQQPFRIAEETFVIPSYNPVPGVGLLYMNALVIRGREPILVDTGATVHSDAYIEAAFSLVDPRMCAGSS